jgi:hypothetical protein
MSVESILLSVESVLLVLTLLAIFLNNRESARFRELASQMDKTTRILARFEYFQIVIDTMHKARTKIDCLVTGRKTDVSDRENLPELMDSLKGAAQRGIKIRYLLPKLQDRLFMGYKYSSAGAEVRYATGFVAHSLRYVLVDKSSIIIATPQATGVNEATRKGYLFASDELNSIIDAHFETHWEKAISLKQYVSEVMNETALSLPELAKEMEIDLAELTQHIAKTLET